MADTDPVQFDQRSADRIARVVKLVEADPRNAELLRAAGRSSLVPEVRLVRVDDATVTGGLVDAVLLLSDGAGGYDDYAGIKLRPLTGQTIPTGQMTALRTEEGADGSVFVAQAAAGGAGSGGGGGTTIDVKESDGTPVVAADTISFEGGDINTPFVVTDAGGGVAVVSIAEAQGSQVGIVTAQSQTWGGAKTFSQGVTVALGAQNHHLSLSHGSTADKTGLLVSDTGGSAWFRIRVRRSDSLDQRLDVTFDPVELSTGPHVTFAYQGTDATSSEVPCLRLMRPDGTTYTGQTGTLGDGSTVTGGLVTTIGGGGSFATEAYADAAGADALADANTYTDTAISGLSSVYQPLDGDLTALAALAGTDTIYYRSAANTWTAVTIGTGLGWSGGTLSATGLSDGDKGDITVSASGATWTIDAGAVTLAKMADLAEDRVIGRSSGVGTGTPQALTITNVLDMASDTDWAVPYRSTVSWGALNPNTTATRKYLSMTGTGAAGQAPAWSAVEAADLPHFHDFTDATPVATDRFPFYSGGASANRDCALSDITAAAQAAYILLQDQKAQNTEGGTFTSGAWQTRTLNTEVTDTGGNCSLSSNQFTLSAGTYEILAIAPAALVNRHQIRLQNVTAGTTLLTGKPSISGATDNTQTDSILVGRFTVAASQALEIQHQCQTTYGVSGFGLAANFTTEVYTVVVLRRVA
jgi:hypothetical protein